MSPFNTVKTHTDLGVCTHAAHTVDGGREKEKPPEMTHDVQSLLGSLHHLYAIPLTIFDPN